MLGGGLQKDFLGALPIPSQFQQIPVESQSMQMAQTAVINPRWSRFGVNLES